MIVARHDRPGRGEKGAIAMVNPTRFVVYMDRRREYRWRFVAGNGRILADSGEGYTTYAACLQGIDVVKRFAPSARVATA